jgi:hypothetical protein
MPEQGARVRTGDFLLRKSRRRGGANRRRLLVALGGRHILAASERVGVPATALPASPEEKR